VCAARLHRGTEGLRVEEVVIPDAGPGEVLIQVRAAGLCGTDVHTAYGLGGRMVTQPVLTLGHETAGTILALGPGVTDWSVGDPVVVAPIVVCGRCRYCRRGTTQLCERSVVLGLGRDGAFAECVLVPETNLVMLPATIPPEIGAVVTDAVATPFHALISRAGLRPGESVAVFGVGGLGQHAVQLARLAGAARIVAVDVREEQLDLALRHGADAVRHANADRGVDLAAEFVGRASTVESAFRSVARGGRVVVVGLGSESITLPPSETFAMREVSLIGSGGYGTDTIADLLALVASGRLSLESSVSHVVGLTGVDDALRMLRDRTEPTRRIIMVP
jgi:propanol-preferring alcohol dehydrogenase